MNLPRCLNPTNWSFRAMLLASVWAAALGAASDPKLEPPPYQTRPEVQAFIQSLVERDHFDGQALSDLMARVHYNSAAAALVAPPKVPVRRSWRVYRSRFVEPIRIRAGVAFWRAHSETLARAEKEYGVPAEIIVGILGVETIFGREMGRFPVLETLTTLAFDYPDSPNKPGRSAMFLHELEDYLVWCRDTRQDAFSFTGSYTGAIGIPQFLPSSLRTYAVDFDGDGRVDVRGSAEDAIGSVARYLKLQGWESRRPVFWRLARTPKALAALEARADGSPDLKWRAADLLDAGIRPLQLRNPRQLRSFRKKEGETKLVLVDLPTPDRPTDYLLGLNNFYVITRYNHSFFYAMAVVDLGSAVKRAVKRNP